MFSLCISATNPSGQTEVLPRKSQASVLVNKFLFIHGGVDARGNYLKELWHISISKQLVPFRL